MTLALRENIIEKLVMACDDNEQYSRRINGIDKENGGKKDNISVINKLTECYENIDVNFDSKAIDRVHRIGKTFENENGKFTQQIILKFRNWSDRQKNYKARPKGERKPVKPSFRVKLDLTNRRFKLLKTAGELIKNSAVAKYAFADINCSLVIKMNDESLCFSKMNKN